MTICKVLFASLAVAAILATPAVGQAAYGTKQARFARVYSLNVPGRGFTAYQPVPVPGFKKFITRLGLDARAGSSLSGDQLRNAAASGTFSKFTVRKANRIAAIMDRQAEGLLASEKRQEQSMQFPPKFGE